MILLAIETSVKDASVCLFEEGKILGECAVSVGNTHSVTLLPMIEHLYKLTEKKPDAYAVAVGPGSFTGIRIGVSTVKGLAFGTSAPCVPVSTLEGCAYNLSLYDGILVPVLDARRDRVYTAIFRSKNGVVERLTEDAVLPVSELDKLLSSYDLPIYLTGDGYDLCKKEFTVKTEDTPMHLRRLSALGVGLAGEKKLKNKEFVTAEVLSPIYLQETQAEREYKEKLEK